MKFVEHMARPSGVIKQCQLFKFPYLHINPSEVEKNDGQDVRIDQVVGAASKLVGWTLGTFRRRSRFLMLTAWKSLIQSKLDYCSQRWSPSDQASISKLGGQ